MKPEGTGGPGKPGSPESADAVVSASLGRDALVEGSWACPWLPAATVVEKLVRLEQRRSDSRTTTDRLGDRLVQFAGSGMFALLHALWFTAWILANVGWVPGVAPFDPYPFSFLTLVVSLEAIFITLAVLNQQNRMSRDEDRRARLELVVNVLAERESTVTMKMLERLATRMGVAVDDLVESDLLDETDLEQLLAHLDRRVPKS
jgi:uncharacterized membrane protein